jgi:hypothetical protein
MLELSFYPYAVILQVTPIVSIAPLIFIYVEARSRACCSARGSWRSSRSCSTTLGLNSVDHNLRDLFRIYGANRWQRLRYLQLPSALPYFLGGLKIAGRAQPDRRRGGGASWRAPAASAPASPSASRRRATGSTSRDVRRPRLVARWASSSSPRSASCPTCCSGSGTKARSSRET